MKKLQLFPRLGGKFYEANYLIPRFPKHMYYYEVFLGSGVLLMSKTISKQEFGNDIDWRLVSLFECVKDKNLLKELEEKCKYTLDSKTIYRLEKQKYNDEVLSVVDRAYNYLYLCKFGFNSFPDSYANPLTTRIDALKNFAKTFRLMVKRLPEIHNRIKDVHFSDYDFADFLKSIEPREDNFIIADPPYIETHGYSKEYVRHEKNASFPIERYIEMRDLLEEQTEGGSKWMITCNSINKYFDNMKNIKIEFIKRKACINKNKERKDVHTKVIMNYNPHSVVKADLNDVEFGDVLSL